MVACSAKTLSAFVQTGLSDLTAQQQQNHCDWLRNNCHRTTGSWRLRWRNTAAMVEHDPTVPSMWMYASRASCNPTTCGRGRLPPNTSKPTADELQRLKRLQELREEEDRIRNAAAAHDTDSVVQAAVKVRTTFVLAVVRQPCVDCGSRGCQSMPLQVHHPSGALVFRCRHFGRASERICQQPAMQLATHVSLDRFISSSLLIRSPTT